MMSALPPGLVAYSRSPDFDKETLPAALQRSHSTKAATWALIHVVEGELLYRILEPAGETMLKLGEAGVVRPTELHEVHPVGPMRMYVEFFRTPADRAD